VKSLISLTVLATFVVGACTAAATPSAAPATPAAAEALDGAAASTPAPPASSFRLVTVGGSFTYGPNVQRRDTWPRQLERMLRPVVPLELVTNLGQITKTSQDVLDEQLPIIESYQPDIITLQIGANDVVNRIVTMDDYRANVGAILDGLLAIVPARRVLVVTTPDFTLTWGTRLTTRSEHVAEANEIIEQAAADRGIEVIDISLISGRVHDDASLIHRNGLDPSEKQYAGWVELIAPRVRAALAEARP